MSVKPIVDFSAYKGKISNSGHDERGRYSGGKAGDQSGDEWYIRSWYSRPWNVVIRFTDRNIANMLATLSIYAAKNPKVGYDQGQRTSYWYALKKAGYDPRNITTYCEEDCSAGVLANVRAALELTGHSTWASRININGYTGNMRGIICGCGASVKTFTDYSHTHGSKYLLPGDILLNTSAHTAVNVGIGSGMSVSQAVPSNTTKPVETKPISNKVKYTKTLQHALNTSYGLSLAVDGDPGKNTQAAIDKHYLYYHKAKIIKNSHVKWLQEMLVIFGYKIAVDGSFGPKTEDAVKQFQKKYGLTVDGYAGVKTHLKMLNSV